MCSCGVAVFAISLAFGIRLCAAPGIPRACNRVASGMSATVP
jgi:hypothetical protein